MLFSSRVGNLVGSVVVSGKSVLAGFVEMVSGFVRVLMSLPGFCFFRKLSGGSAGTCPSTTL